MKVAVVTGASKGLGKQTAIELGRAGYHVAVNYNKSAKNAEEVARLAGEQSVAIKADVGNLREVEAMREEIYRRWGRVDVLVNNAGITTDGLMINYAEDDWDEVMRVNFSGCFNAVKSFAPLMIRSGGGHIVSISSRSGLKGKAGQPAYSASKAAVIGLTITFAQKLGAHNIRMNCILPGYMPTGMGVRAKGAMRGAREESILGGLTDPKEVAGFIVYLVKTETITGQVFCLDSRI